MTSYSWSRSYFYKTETADRDFTWQQEKKTSKENFCFKLPPISWSHNQTCATSRVTQLTVSMLTSNNADMWPNQENIKKGVVISRYLLDRPALWVIYLFIRDSWEMSPCLLPHFSDSLIKTKFCCSSTLHKVWSSVASCDIMEMSVSGTWLMTRTHPCPGDMRGPVKLSQTYKRGWAVCVTCCYNIRNLCIAAQLVASQCYYTYSTL